MGRNNKSLNYQLHQRMQSMTRFGESRHQAKAEHREYCENHGLPVNSARATGIFSHSTYATYEQTSKEFAGWLKDNYSEIRRIDDISRDHCKEYLQERQERGLSAWTTSKDMSALNKILNYDITKNEAGLEQRHLSDIIRSREDCDHDTRDYTRYQDQITLALGSGCRRQSVCTVTPSDFRRDENGQVVSVYLCEKGGREREATILQEYREDITNIVDEASGRPEEPLFDEYDIHIDNHSFRSEYATARYEELLEAKGYSDDDYMGYDAECIRQVSEDLGHSRLSVVVDHYLR